MVESLRGWRPKYQIDAGHGRQRNHAQGSNREPALRVERLHDDLFLLAEHGAGRGLVVLVELLVAAGAVNTPLGRRLDAGAALDLDLFLDEPQRLGDGVG